MLEKKKVIFINISFNSLVQYRSIALEKIKYLGEQFKNDEDYLLWWRPHPCLSVELKAYDEELFSEYRKLVAEYVSNKWGVFDETNSIEKAYGVSDIYYGDPGTVMNEFQNRGKPIFPPVYYKFFFPIGICREKDWIYGTDHDTGAIVRYDIEAKSWEYVRQCFEKDEIKKAFHKSCVWKEKLYLIPYMADFLVEYDLRTAKIRKINLNLCENKKGKNKTNFWGYYFYNDELFLLPASYSEILSVNTKNYKVSTFLSVEKLLNQDEPITFLSWEEVKKGQIVLSSMNRNEVVFFDLDTKEKKIFSVGNKNYKYTDIRKYGNWFLLLVKNEPAIVKWNIETGETKIFEFDKKTFGEYGKSIFDDYASCIYKNKLFCFPAKSRAAYSFDIEKEQLEKLYDLDKYITSDISVSQFDTVTVKNGKVFFQTQELKFLEFDLNLERTISEGVCKLSNKEINKMELERIKELGE